MFPRYFPYGQLPTVPNVNSLIGLSLGLPLDSASIVPGQDISSLLLSAQSNLSASPSLHAASPYFLPQTTQFLGGLPVTNAVNPLIAQLNLSQMLPLLNPGLLSSSTCDLTTTSSESSDAHTIVRAPVLYGNSNGTAVSQVSSKEANKSPPDQIVASYAAAARAAAIAYQQPLSSAAEVFLSAAASAAGPLTNSSGYAVTTAKNRTTQKRASGVICVNSSSGGIKSSLAVVKSEGTKPPLPWNSAWTRIVDRQSDVVVYISPGGSRLKSMAEVRAHLERWLSVERAAAISDECINTSFCFDANREVRLVSAPDDSVFVFPEEVEPSSRPPTVTGAPSLPSAPSPPPSSSTSPLTSKIEDISSSAGGAASTSITPENELTTSVAASTAPIAVKRSAPTPERTDGKDGMESTVLPSTSEAETNGATKEDESRQPKKSKIEPEPTSVPQLLTPLPSLSNDVALTTPSFVARGMTRAGGAPTVVPSVVPSVLPPTSTASSTAGAYALAQHLATLQQHQALLASAGLINPVDAAHQQQQQQLFEHYKQQHQQQAVAAAVTAALLLQQQQQHQLQLQQHLQTVYATALQQQQHQQTLQQQHHQDGNQ
ncbi:hypothetical protein TcWFU_007385 [Taenia crassiceps]|uniref:MBD domain-containing protein n=1 Tax=Taenia crassiceps TaxID=6207 RepID=A0ABR4QSQ6_9CEST